MLGYSGPARQAGPTVYSKLILDHTLPLLLHLPDGRCNASPCRERTCYIGDERNLESAIQCSTGFPHPAQKGICSFSILSKPPMGETCPVFPRIPHP